MNSLTREGKIIVFGGLVLIIVILIFAWAPWLDSQRMTFKHAELGGSTCDYSIRKWTPFGRYGESCGVEWSVTFWGKTTIKSGDAFLVQPSSKEAKLYENCAKAKIPQTELDTTLDVENHTAIIRWWEGERQENIELKLPYYPEIDFEGCSESAKTYLRHIQETVVFP